MKTPADTPPFSGAEMLSLKDFCLKMSIESSEALRELREAGLSVYDEKATVAHIARVNGMSPAMLYMIIRKLERPGVARPASLVSKPSRITQ